jgi:hypothetical protein
MPKPQHTHTKDCPDYKEAIADRAKRDAAAIKRESRLQVLARSHWLDAYDKVR